MKTTMKAILVAAAMLVGGAANATVVMGSQNQTIDGQNFSFSLLTPGYAASTGSVLTLRVQGDFNGEAGEFVTLFIEGNNVGTYGFASAGAYDLVDYRTATSTPSRSALTSLSAARLPTAIWPTAIWMSWSTSTPVLPRTAAGRIPRIASPMSALPRSPRSALITRKAVPCQSRHRWRWPVWACSAWQWRAAVRQSKPD
jgi:hypothetical protein